MTSAQRPSVAVAMATFNGVRFLEAQLRSLCEQTDRPDEVVIRDDGSTDGSLAVLEQFRATAPFPVTLLENGMRLGVARNFAQAIAAMRSDLVLLCDQDDVWAPHKVQVLRDVFAADPTLTLAVHDCELVDGDLVGAGDTTLGRLARIPGTPGDLLGMATAVRGPFARACVPIPDHWPETHDRWLQFCVGALGRKRLVKEVLALYRRHEATVSWFPVTLDLPLTARVRMQASKWNGDARATAAERPTPELDWLRGDAQRLVDEGLVDAATLRRACSSVGHAVDSRRLRRALLEQTGLHRLLAVARLYACGGYSHYSGILSAGKDALEGFRTASTDTAASG
jgi:hypothetical protein